MANILINLVKIELINLTVTYPTNSNQTLVGLYNATVPNRWSRIYG